jgi:hypothetical protein
MVDRTTCLHCKVALLVADALPCSSNREVASMLLCNAAEVLASFPEDQRVTAVASAHQLLDMYVADVLAAVAAGTAVAMDTAGQRPN